MRKISLLMLAIVMVSATAKAKIMPKYVSEPTELYDFSADFVDAVENCKDYKTNFALKNTPYAKLGEFAEDSELKSSFEIYGKGDNICRMQIRLQALGKGETRFNCRLNDEQRALLVRAIKDKSTEEYVITLPTENEADCSGCSTAITFSGNMFDTTLALLKPKVCAELHIMPTKEELKAARAINNNFSEEFRQALSDCSAQNLLRQTATVEDELQIVGLTADKKCQIKYLNFDMFLLPQDLKNVANFDDMQHLLIKHLDEANYDYADKYDESGTLFGLEACRSKDGFYNAGENIFRRGNIESRNGLTATRQKDMCNVTLKNTISIDNIYFRDYSMQCNINVAFLDTFIRLYKDLIDEYGAEKNVDKKGITYTADAMHTKETRKADREIMAKIRQSGYCTAVSPVNPINLEIKDLLYRDSKG